MQAAQPMSEHTRGLWYGVAAYVVWGLSPLFWNAVDGVPALDLITYRVAFAFPILAIAISTRHLWRQVRTDFASAKARLLTTAAAALLMTNWGLYVWAVTSEHVVEASLGYFINPLVSIALGVIVLHERLRRLQWVAVGIAAVGVIGMGLKLGAIPWISLTLAFSFGVYGLLKKRVDAPKPLPGLFGEVAVLTIPAIVVWLAYNDPASPVIAPSATALAFLLGTGAITVIPLLLFGASAQRIPLATVGVLQYIAPTLQLLVGLTVLNEQLTPATLFGFAMVWTALALYTADSVRSNRAELAGT